MASSTSLHAPYIPWEVDIFSETVPSCSVDTMLAIILFPLSVLIPSDSPASPTSTTARNGVFLHHHARGKGLDPFHGP